MAPDSGVDISGAMGAIGATSSTPAPSGSNYKGQLVDAFGQQRAAVQDEVSQTIQAGANKAIVDGQKDVGELTAQNNTRRAALALGTNMDDTSQIVTQLGTTMRNTALALDQQTKVVANMNANSNLFSNPLGFLYNLLYGGQEQDKLDGLQTELSTASKSLQTINQATQQTAVTQNAIQVTKTDASIAANQDLIKNQAAIAADQAKARLAGVDINMANNLSEMDARAVSMANQARTMSMQEQRFAWEKQDRTDTDKATQSLMDTYNAGAATVGAPQATTMASFKALQATLGKPKMGYAITQGFALQNGLTPPIGRTPYEAVVNATTLGVQMPAAQKVVLNDLGGALAGSTNIGSVAEMLKANGLKAAAPLSLDMTATQQATAMIKDHSKEGQLALREQYLTYQVKQWANNPTTSGDSNIFAPPPLNVLKDAKYMSTNPFLDGYIKPMIDAAGAPIKFDLSNMTGYINTANAKGISTADIVDGLTWIGHQLVANNNTTKGYERFGIKAPENLPMPVTIAGNGMVSGFNRTLDVMNKSDMFLLASQVISRNSRPAPGKDPMSILAGQLQNNTPFGVQ